MKYASLTEHRAGSRRRLLIALACLSVLGPTQSLAAAPGAGLESRNAAAVRQAFEEWRAGGSVFDLLAPDVVWTIHGSGPVAGTYRGVDDFLERASAPLVSRLATPITPNVHHVSAADDRVIIRFDGVATTTSGTPYRNQFVWIFRMEDGTVVEAEAFLDLVAYQEVVDNNPPREQ